MSDLKRWQVSDERLTEIIRGPASDAGAMATELRDYRSARAASAERVRTVVREAFAQVTHYSGHDFAQRHIEDVAARAAEQLAGVAVGLSADDQLHLRWLKAVANVGIERLNHLRHDPVINGHVGRCAAAVALVDRLLASPPAGAPLVPGPGVMDVVAVTSYHTAVDYRAGIRTILDSDMPAGDVRRALAELLGRR